MTIKPDSVTPTHTYAISEDGHIRLRLAELRAVRLLHLISGLDEDIPELDSGGALPTTISGYTEWVSNTTPVISIGWDWQMADSTQPCRIGEPRSNLILQDVHYRDVDYFKTALLLQDFVDALDWQRIVMKQIAVRYHWQ